MTHDPIHLPLEELQAFCHKWRITDLALFGSALRGELQAASDIDLLATFAESADWSLLDHASMELELIDLLGREVDLVWRRSLENSQNAIRRREILDSARSIFHAA